jgi:RND family efflux transporter MFP subunit
VRNILIFALFFTSYSCKKELNTEKPPSFPVLEITTKDTVGYTDYVAEIKAVENIEIRTRVSGFIEKIAIDEGKDVEKNQVLFSISSKEYEEELTKSRAFLKMALADVKVVEMEVKNVETLVHKNIVSDYELQLAKAKLEIAEAKVSEARANVTNAEIKLSYTKIKAPFKGTINRILHKAGSLVEKGTLLTNLSNNSEVFVYFDVSEKEYLNYAYKKYADSVNNKGVDLILANGKKYETTGVIETIEGEIDENTGNIAFRARFKNENGVIKHGASGKIRIEKKYPKALLVPQKSTFDLQERLYVYVIDKTNKITARSITAKNRIPHFFIVDNGIEEGDKILYEGIQNVREGKVITPQLITFNEILQEFIHE